MWLGEGARDPALAAQGLAGRPEQLKMCFLEAGGAAESDVIGPSVRPVDWLKKLEGWSARAEERLRGRLEQHVQVRQEAGEASTSRFRVVGHARSWSSWRGTCQMAVVGASCRNKDVKKSRTTEEQG